MPKPGGKLVRASVAARTLGLHVDTIRRWIRGGKIGGTRQARRWYVFRDDLDKLTRTQECVE